MFDITKLNKYSKNIAELLFRDYPEWKQYASINLPSGNFSVEIPSPTGVAIRNLYISTTETCVSISYFDYFHEQFGFTNTPEQDYYSVADFIKDFINEDILIVFKKHGFLFIKWQTPYIMTHKELQSIKPSQISCIRSWKGTYDRGNLKYKKLLPNNGCDPTNVTNVPQKKL